MSATANRLERRGAQRFEVHQPLAIQYDARTVHGFTQDLSNRGIFIYAETEMPKGAVVALTFTMPSEITLGDNMPVRCRGRVLRSSGGQPGQRSGIAIQLDSYEYLPAGDFISQFVRPAVSSATAASGPVSR